MKESAFQAKLLKALRQHPALKDAVIFKHSDRVNGGIPDISITVNGNTSWFELKVAPNTLSKLQEFYIDRLGARAFVIQSTVNGIIIAHRKGTILYCKPLKEVVEKISSICIGGVWTTS